MNMLNGQYAYAYELNSLLNLIFCSRFCLRHGPDVQQSAATPPPELLAVAQAMLPRIFMRLILYLRDTSDPGKNTELVNDND